MFRDGPQPGIETLPNGVRWPKGRNVAVTFNVAYEAWSPGHVSAVGPMGNPLQSGIFDPNADSYGRYGVTTGIHRLLRILDKAGVAAGIFISAAIADERPDDVRAIVAAGHDLIAHSYYQDWIPATLDPGQEEENIRRTTEALGNILGHAPAGWISPRVTPSVDTVRRLVEHGYTWHGDVIDGDLPYRQKFAEGDIVAVPMTTEINDLAHSIRFGRTPRQFVQMFDDVLEHAVENQDDVIVIDVLAHCHCYGRPFGAWAYAEILERCAGRDDIWVTTRGAIADFFLSRTA